MLVMRLTRCFGSQLSLALRGAVSAVILNILVPGHLACEKGFQILRPNAIRTPCGICGVALGLWLSVAAKFKAAIGLPRIFKGMVVELLFR